MIWCKECAKAYYRGKKDPDGKCYSSARQLKYKERNRVLLRGIKTSAGCAHCGEDDPVCLDFHHEDRKIKLYNICQLALSACSIEKLRAEIEKCIVLCSNCHRKLEAGVRARLKLEA